jgi:polar amino acid transport system substrate-binding protein
VNKQNMIYTKLLRKLPWLVMVLITFAVPPAFAQLAPGKIVVATRVLPPFIIKDGDSYAGFSAALWEYIAQDAGVAFSWKEVGNVKEIIATVEKMEAQAAIAAISITSEREAKFDFSQPIFESGLQIMVPAGADGGFGFMNVLRILSSGALPAMLALLAALVLIPAHVVWLAERKHSNPLFSRTYIPGIFHALWWAVGATAGQQPDIPRSGLGRFLSAISILISVIFMAFFTASLTASITVGQLQGDIKGPTDLIGKRVGTTVGSTAAKYLLDRGITPREYEKIDDAYRELETNKLDAVVFDAPVLLYYAANEGRDKVRVIGGIFRRENYGIMFPPGSLLRKRINASLLKMREDGSYDRLYDRWFVSSTGN